MQELIPQAEVVVFDGSSHFFLVEQFDRFMQTLRDWVARHTP
jgi:pimeloyl-ACP methyl ester carboxylesterase